MKVSVVKSMSYYFHSLTADMQNGKVHLENKLAVGLEVKTYSINVSFIQYLCIYNGKENIKTYTNVHNSFIYNSPQLYYQK